MATQLNACPMLLFIFSLILWCWCPSYARSLEPIYTLHYVQPCGPFQSIPVQIHFAPAHAAPAWYYQQTKITSNKQALSYRYEHPHLGVVQAICPGEDGINILDGGLGKIWRKFAAPRPINQRKFQVGVRPINTERNANKCSPTISCRSAVSHQGGYLGRRALFAG